MTVRTAALLLSAFAAALPAGCGKAVPAANAAAGTAGGTAGAPRSPVDTLAFSPDGQLLAANFNQDVKIFDVKSGSDKTSLDGTPYSEW